MAKVVKKTFGSSNTTLWKTFLDSFECPLLTVTAASNLLTILVDNTIQINLNSDNGVWFNPVTITYNGSTTGEVVRLWGGGSNIRVTVATTDTLFYIQFQDGDSRRMLFVYEISGEEKMYGYYGSGSTMNVGFKDISSISLTNISTSASYSHKNIFGFTTELNTIGYSNGCGLSNSSNEVVLFDPNLMACTTVTGDKMYTLGGKNYYSVGTNRIILIDG